MLLFGQALVSPIIPGLSSYQQKSCQLVVTATSPTRSLGSVPLGGSGVLSRTIGRKWKRGGHLYEYQWFDPSTWVLVTSFSAKHSAGVLDVPSENTCSEKLLLTPHHGKAILDILFLLR